jgi:hypothetical protein
MSLTPITCRPLTADEAQLLREEMDSGQTDTVTLGMRVGLTLDEANSLGFRDLVGRLWYIHGLIRKVDDEVGRVEWMKEACR